MTSFTSLAGQMLAVYDSLAKVTTLSFDLDGDGSGSELVIAVSGQATSPSAFLL